MAQRIYIETYGCSLNQSDSEVMAGLLEGEGFVLCDSPEEADLVLLNTCTVKDQSYRNFQKRLTALEAQGQKVLLAGCIPQAAPRETVLDGHTIVGTHALDRIPEAVRLTLGGREGRFLKPSPTPRLSLPKRRKNPAVEIIPICKGCLDHCAFCQTKLARGGLRSYPVAEIVEQARRAVAEGVCEIWLTSQDNGAYGHDIGSSLPELLGAVLNLPGQFMVRLGMANPHFVRDHKAALLEVFQHPKIYKFLHIPVQSGSDKVLNDMLRHYSAEDFEGLCAAFRERIPQIHISTDIIAGFPTETEVDFEATLSLLRRTRPETINRSKFSPRPGTRAARLKPLPSAVLSRRSKTLSDVAEELFAAGNAAWMGWEGEALVSDRRKEGSVVARNFAYKPIVVAGDYPLRSLLKLKITGSTVYHLMGEVLPVRSEQMC